MEDLAKVEAGKPEEVPNNSENSETPKKVKRRCGVCRKKLGLTGIFLIFNLLVVAIFLFFGVFILIYSLSMPLRVILLWFASILR